MILVSWCLYHSVLCSAVESSHKQHLDFFFFSFFLNKSKWPLCLEGAVRMAFHNEQKPSPCRSERRQISVYWETRSRPTHWEMCHKNDAVLKMSGHWLWPVALFYCSHNVLFSACLQPLGLQIHDPEDGGKWRRGVGWKERGMGGGFLPDPLPCVTSRRDSCLIWSWLSARLLLLPPNDCSRSLKPERWSLCMEKHR